jgi:CubicO group peptidase (beta-lactamase class C family)
MLRKLVVAAAIFVTGCSHQGARPIFAAGWRPEDVARRDRMLSVTPEVDRFLAEEFAKKGLQNLSFGFVAAGRLVWGRGLGYRDPNARDAVGADTVFRIGSITKVFTGAAILALRDAGKLSLDDLAEKYVPELEDAVYPTQDSARITIRHLVTHSSGLPRLGGLHYSDGHEFTQDEFLAAVKGVRLEFSPGDHASYSNLGMAIGGLIVERVSGKRYRDFVAENILAPLAMNDTTFELGSVPPSRMAAGYAKQGSEVRRGWPLWRLGAVESMGGLYSSVSDMAKFMAWELAAWPPRDDPDTGPVRRSSLRESQSIAGFAPAGSDAFGVNFVVKHDAKLGRIAFHNGSTEAFSSSMWLLPEKNVGVIALSGTTDFSGLDEIARGALLLMEAADKH